MHKTTVFWMTLGLGVLVMSQGGIAAPLAVLISGGGNPAKNRCDFYQAINQAQDVYSSWNTVVAVSDGKREGPPNAVLCNDKQEPILDESRRTVLTRSVPQGNNELIPATFESIKAMLKQKVKALQPGDPVLLYLDDHGLRDQSQSKMTLWWERLTPAQMRELISIIPASNRVIMVPNFCFGGGFLDALKNSRGKLRKNACAFSTAQAHETVSVKDHWLTFADKKKTFREAFHAMTDNINYSLPSSSEDEFLEQYLRSAQKKKHLPSCADCLTTAVLSKQGESALSPDNLAQLDSSSPLERLKQEKARLEKEAANQLKKCPSFNPSTLSSDIARREKELKKLKAKVNHLSDINGYARYAYILSQMGEKALDRYYEVDRQLESMEKGLRKMDRELAQARRTLQRTRNVESRNALKLAVRKKSNAVHSTKAKLKRMRRNLRPVDTEVWRWDLSATPENPKFMDFVKNNSRNSDEQWKPDTPIQYAKAEAEHDKGQAELRPLKQYSRKLKQIEALNQMIRTGDRSAAEEYLGLIECGTTPTEVAR